MYIRRLDRNSRVSIPTDVRDLLGIHEDTLVELTVNNDVVVMRKHVPEDLLLDTLDVLEYHLERKSPDLDYRRVREIEKRLGEIRGILSNDSRKVELRDERL